MKAIINHRNEVASLVGWEDIMRWTKFSRKKIYRKLQDVDPKWEWRDLIYRNNACPRSCFILLLICHGKLATKDRLYRIGMVDNMNCCESIHLLFFDCDEMRKIWIQILEWLQMKHIPSGWHDEIQWLTQHTRSKSLRARVLQMAATYINYVRTLKNDI